MIMILPQLYSAHRHPVLHRKYFLQICSKYNAPLHQEHGAIKLLKNKINQMCKHDTGGRVPLPIWLSALFIFITLTASLASLNMTIYSSNRTERRERQRPVPKQQYLL